MRTIQYLILPVVLSALFCVSINTHAQEGFDDEAVVKVFLKKIRDEESNYLRDVTRAAAREINKSGEFLAKPYKRRSKGPIIEVQALSFNFEKHKDGMSAKEMTTAGLSLVSDVGSLFGFGKESEKINEVNASLNEQNSILDAWGEDEKVMVTMSSSVLLKDSQSGAEIVRKISYEKVFNSKSEFVAAKEGIIQSAVVDEIKKVLVEYLDDEDF